MASINQLCLKSSIMLSLKAHPVVRSSTVNGPVSVFSAKFSALFSWVFFLREGYYSMNRKYQEWKGFHVKLALHFNDDLRDKSNNNVTLMCDDGQSMEANRTLLASFSPYFKELLQEQSGKHSFINLLNVSFNHLKAIVHYIYCGQVNLKKKEMDSFIDTARYLKIRGLDEEEEEEEEVEDDDQDDQNLYQAQEEPQSFRPIAREAAIPDAIPRGNFYQSTPKVAGGPQPRPERYFSSDPNRRRPLQGPTGHSEVFRERQNIQPQTQNIRQRQPGYPPNSAPRPQGNFKSTPRPMQGPHGIGAYPRQPPPIYKPVSQNIQQRPRGGNFDNGAQGVQNMEMGISQVSINPMNKAPKRSPSIDIIQISQKPSQATIDSGKPNTSSESCNSSGNDKYFQITSNDQDESKFNGSATRLSNDSARGDEYSPASKERILEHSEVQDQTADDTVSIKEETYVANAKSDQVPD